MSNMNDISRYVTRVDDGLIRPMTVRELMSRLNELISIDKSIARMPVGLSTDAEGNMIYVPRVSYRMTRRKTMDTHPLPILSACLPTRTALITVFPSAL